MKEFQETYKFSPFKIIKVISDGNQRYDIREPKPRSGHRIVADSGNVYSFGGYNPIADRPFEETEDFVWVAECLLFRELWKYNIATKTWKKLKVNGSMPQELASHAAILIGKHMVVFGGTGVPFGDSSSNSVHACNIETREWITLDTTGDVPLKQYGQALTVHKNKLYAIGGTTGFEYSMDIHCLDLETKMWSNCSFMLPQPEPRYRHEVAVKDDKLFIFGGGTATESFTMEKIPVFDIEKRLWGVESTLDDHPGPRRCHGCVQIDNDVYISGGINNQRMFADIWKINLNLMKWEKLSRELPEALFFHATAVTPEGQMFVFGGVTSNLEQTRTNNMYSVWLKIPSLQEICWEAIRHYMPTIGEKSPEELRQIGIPPRFIDRIDFV